MNDKSEFEKLLKKSLADVTDILEEKSGEVDSGEYTKSYHRVLVSHDDLYENIEDVDFVHKKPGIQQKISNELKTKKFNFKHSHILDLHGFNPVQAEEQINIFIEYHYNRNTKYVLIIHGKGTKNQSKIAPIKNLVEKIILASPYILAANSANKNNGGRGATVLLIKK